MEHFLDSMHLNDFPQALRRLTCALLVCVLSFGAAASAQTPVHPNSAADRNTKKTQIKQDEFDKLIEQLAQHGLLDMQAVEETLGVKFVGPQPKTGPGWVEYSPLNDINRIGATYVRYEKNLEADAAQSDRWRVNAVGLVLRFSDKDRLSSEPLWKKYGKVAYSFFPARGLCLFRVDGIRVFMEYSDDSPDLYVSRVTLTWEKSPRHEHYPVILYKSDSAE